MESLTEYRAFVALVEHGSFTRAADRLGVPKSTVSRAVAQLEARLAAKLVHRTTRAVAVTEVGETFYEHASRALQAIADAESAVRQLQARPSGRLRIAMPLRGGSVFLSELIRDFSALYPEVSVEAITANRWVDMVEEQFDVAIRGGSLDDSGLVARRVASIAWTWVATPAYLDRHGRPRTLQDLERHPLLLPLRNERKLPRHPVEGGPPPRISSNDFHVLLTACLADQGIAQLPDLLIGDAVQRGRLEQVLPDDTLARHSVHLVFPDRRHLSPTVRAFVDFAVERFAAVEAELTEPSSHSATEQS